jgi:adenylate kinase
MNAHGENNRAAWLDGPSAKCSALPEQLGSVWRLLLLGAPGVGKGTQAALLSRRLGACHLSTGDVFRAARSRSESDPTAALTGAMDFMRCGHLVPDAIVWDIVRERIGCLRCQGGFVLDGFPRTLTQAESLKLLLEKERLPLHAVVNYVLPVTEIVSRLSGRRTCERCTSIFHMFTRPPRDEGICDHCGGRLYQREDDRLESIAVRIEDYERSTAPLIQFYQDLGLLTSVMVTGSPEEIFQRALAVLEARRNAAQL